MENWLCWGIVMANNNSAMRSKGEFINHINAVRIRVVGDGALQLTLQSLDDVVQQVLLPLTLSEATNIQPTRLANFKQQRARLYGTTTEFGEYMKITRIVIFSKPVATGYPG